ncbi:MAG: inorganic phosphate transporter [Oscillatoria princeps RMCB-10]|jgi:PiT family inorganic phosphate transporter|nr:inorganic phosphate transporter [Oscillatoria princeps RMCB-10]
MTVLLALLAFYVAWNLGANDVANSMGTSVGSKALTLRQALAIAGILEFTGAVLLGQRVSATLATEIVNPAEFAGSPGVLLAGMVSVTLACGLWVQVATLRGWPVSSSHAVVGAIAGFSWVAGGAGAVRWSQIGTISLTWLVTPAVSAAIAAGLYSLLKRWILDRPDPLQQLYEWVPWISALLLGVFGSLALPALSAPAQAWIAQRFAVAIPPHDIPLALGAGAAAGLTLVSWRQLDTLGASQGPAGGAKAQLQTGGLKPNYKRDTGEPDPKSLEAVERFLARFQILSACFVAFAHGCNDVGNAVAPLAVINYILRTGSVPSANFAVPFWILLLGGAGIVAGLAVLGKNVIATVGEGIIPLQPSGGFCAELATATTVLLASRLGLPVSTSHALVGGVAGVGLAGSWSKTGSGTAIRWETVRGIVLAWLITVPIAAGLGAGIFTIARSLGGAAWG